MSFPRLLSRTQSFRLGRPVRFTISPDGRRVLFLRSRGGEDPVRGLWSLEIGSGEERLLADPVTLGDDDSAPSAQERIRRERARDRSSGIVDYSADEEVRVLAFTIQEQLSRLDVSTGEVTPLAARTPLSAATISPDGVSVAYVSAGELRVIGPDDRVLCVPESPDVTYGLPEHVAAESMGRHRGYWWSPDSDRLAVARVDNSPVQTWHLADPSRPDAPPMSRRYPPAGTDNAEVSLWVVGLDGSRVEVLWDRDAFEYLVEVLWDAHGLFIVVQDRAQHELRVLAVVAATGATTEIARVTDPAWTQIVPGVPTHLPDGSLVWTVDDDQTRRLTVDGTPVTPGGLQVSEVVGVDGDAVLFVGSREPTEEHLFLWSPDAGTMQLTRSPGRHTGRRSAGLTVISSSTLSGHSVTVHGDEVHELSDLSAGSPVSPNVTLLSAGRRELRTAVLFPTGWQGSRLPVLMDPYGGPAGQRVMADRDLYWASQWFADQGFAVIVADGRGTPGRGPAWEREIYLNRSDALLEDQIEALQAVADRYPEIDLSRVGIRGWSAGGYLAALAVLRRPDVFHAAVAGAPVTDHLLYDTHWQERFLGDPRVDMGPYQRASLIDDAPKLTRPLMLIHGLLDDNVYPVHTMRLSAALFAAGRPHTVLPLPGASHMPPDADMLTPQLDFLRGALGIG